MWQQSDLLMDANSQRKLQQLWLLSQRKSTRKNSKNSITEPYCQLKQRITLHSNTAIKQTYSLARMVRERFENPRLKTTIVLELSSTTLPTGASNSTSSTKKSSSRHFPFLFRQPSSTCKKSTGQAGVLLKENNQLPQPLCSLTLISASSLI